jgi:hypothetical protein
MRDRCAGPAQRHCSRTATRRVAANRQLSRNCSSCIRQELYLQRRSLLRIQREREAAAHSSKVCAGN